MKIKKILLFISVLCFISCTQKTTCTQNPNKEYLLAGEQYKYWIEIPYYDADTVSYDVLYFDREYKSLSYRYNTRYQKFYMPEFDDMFYYPTWYFINDTIIDFRTELCRIRVLNEMEFTFEFRSEIYRYKSAPLDIIPEEYRKIQPLPKALQSLP